MKNKVIISSILTIVMCFSLIAGSTFSLFTSEDGVNIAVTSGEVNVTANVVDGSLATYSFGVATEEVGAFENGGTATLTDKATLLVNGLTVGDEATFKILVENKSTVNIQYRVKWYIDGELANVLVATANGNAITNSTSTWTIWEKDSTDKTDEITVSVSFPLGTENASDYAGKSANIAFTVEAVQKNGVGLVLLNGKKQESLTKALENATASDTVALYGEHAPFEVDKNITVELNGVTIVAPEGINAITLTESATIKLVGDSYLKGGKNGSAISVAEGEKLTLTGDALTAVGNGGKDYVADAPQYSSDDTATDFADTGASAIGGKGDIYITGVKSLTALGYGAHASGIGGESTKITIESTTIEKVRGGYVNETGVHRDDKYLKTEPEGGAAIGSSVHGAVITLNNVTLKEALGGSKAAGIGASYHRGATINITNSVIHKVVGGNSSAGIGSSRVSSEDIDQSTVINISGSTITAIGGRYGAGIGGGYDTHCTSHGDKSRVTINITGGADDTITAQGGTYAAGIGTGYHMADLAGAITGDVVINATSGEKFYKDAYTQAQDIGFGVVDKTREGLNNYSTFNNKGTVIALVEMTSVSDSTEFKSAITSGGAIVLDGEVAVDNIGSYDFSIGGYSGIAAESTIIGGTVSRDTASGAPLYVSTTETVTFKGVTFESVKGSAVLSTRTDGSNVVLENCVFNNQSAPSTGNTGIQIYAENTTWTFNNCEFNNMPIVTNSSDPTGIKLVFNNCTFTWTGANCPAMIQLANYVEAEIEFNNCTYVYDAPTTSTRVNDFVSTSTSTGTSTITFNNFEMVGTAMEGKVWTVVSKGGTTSGKNVTVTATGTNTYTFNGEVVDFSTYLFE